MHKCKNKSFYFTNLAAIGPDLTAMIKIKFSHGIPAAVLGTHLKLIYNRAVCTQMQFLMNGSHLRGMGGKNMMVSRREETEQVEINKSFNLQSQNNPHCCRGGVKVLHVSERQMTKWERKTGRKEKKLNQRTVWSAAGSCSDACGSQAVWVFVGAC